MFNKKITKVNIVLGDNIAMIIKNASCVGLDMIYCKSHLHVSFLQHVLKSKLNLYLGLHMHMDLKIIFLKDH